jgi:hypothetical protein
MLECKRISKEKGWLSYGKKTNIISKAQTKRYQQYKSYHLGSFYPQRHYYHINGTGFIE